MRLGVPLSVQGTVFASDCVTPLANATVDIWHADDDGHYDNDTVEFKLRGQVTTNDAGHYEFHTILPGRYLNGSTYRPRHIHYKASFTHQNDLIELTTQLYFEGDEFIANDPWATPTRTIPLTTEEQGHTGVFDIVLPVSL